MPDDAVDDGPALESDDRPGAVSRRDDGSLDGVVIELLPRALYRVEIEPGDTILAHATGDPRRNFMRLLKGDRVRVVRTARNATRGRIVARQSR